MHSIGSLIGRLLFYRSARAAPHYAPANALLQIADKSIISQRPTFERRIGELVRLFLTQAHLDDGTKSRLTRERRVAQGPVKRVVGDQRIMPDPGLMGIARPGITTVALYLPSHRVPER
jgi:hypothetical protein